ncbi:MAG: carboxypeptidase regulatory-like domain-containing protein [Candidatus Aminicenantes bacterium]|nr:carboxypeptidase regulatory-like domain-containing protein [Candidatus Aminicenantes bacterium]
MRKSLSFMLMLLCLAPMVMFAQVLTNGSFSGKVVDVDGKVIAGADIVAIHLPTGTKYVTLTRMNGMFDIPAVRVGGPYTITASFEGFKPEKQEELAVKLGETKYVTFTLQLQTVDAGEIVVTASTPIINPYRTGASQNVAQDSIDNLPTISRSLSDFTRLSPQVLADDETDGAFNAGGRSSRYNNIQIDGAQNNDLFGLGSTGTPGGQSEATIISLEAVQEFQIVLAPYDVRQGMFTGGGINVITKSGQNDFFGSAFFEGRNQDFVGKGPDNQKFKEFTEGIYGGSFGGPIIKDKLFFFVNAEYNAKKLPEDMYIDGSGAAYDWGSQAEADRFVSILEGYGYDAGGYGQVVNDRKKINIFARIDWNISDKHRLTLRHSYLKSDYENLSRSSKTSFWFGNAGIVYKTRSHNTVLELNSTLGNNLHNNLLINYQTLRDNPTYMGKAFPTVVVNLPGSKSMTAGSEEYRHRNILNQDLVEINDTLTLFKGNHTFVFGTHNEIFKFYNVYVQRSFGKYEFKSLDDFEAKKVSRYDRYYSLTGDPNAPAVFNVFQLGLYAMDEWNATPNLKFTVGIRADVPLMPDSPPANPLVFEKFGIPTDQNAGGNILWSPRLGFNFDPTGTQQWEIRGGVGIFSGRNPYVWISNQYSNTGVDLGRYYVTASTNNPINFFYPDPYGQPESPSANAVGDVNLIDKAYRFPQVFKANIAIDKQLPFGFTGTVEFIYSKSLNDAMFQNINIAPTGATAFDGRPLYGAPSTSGSSYGSPNYINKEFKDVILIKNTKKGYQWTVSGQLQKEWVGNMINIGYSYGVARDQFAGTSSRAISNWGYNITEGDPNNPTLGISAFDPGHRIMVAISKKFEFFKKAPTIISVFFSGRSGKPYNTRYYNDFNGDGKNNDSIWVPANEGDIILTKGTWADLDKYIKDDPALDKYRGKILPRYASRDKWYNELDFKISQHIPVPVLKGHRIEIYMNLKNFLNLLNSKWGVYRYITFDDAPLTYMGMDQASGKPKFEFWGNAEKDKRYIINQLLSRWQMLLGIKYRF